MSQQNQAIAHRAAVPNALDAAWGSDLPSNDGPQEGSGLVDGHEVRVFRKDSSWRTTLDGITIYEGSGEEARRVFDSLFRALDL